MSLSIEISFSKSVKVSGGLVVALGSLAAPVSAAAKSADPAGQLDKAVKVAGFAGKSFSTVDVFAPVDAPADRIALVGTGDPDKLSAHEWMRVGGKICSVIGKASKVTVLLGDAGVPSAEAAADMALGLLMRAYSFDTYKTKKPEDDDNGSRKVSVVFQHEDASGCKKAFATRQAISEGVELARNLVNEPANVLGPVEFADRAKQLESLGMEVEILTEKDMKKLKMEALLGVSLGSPRPPRLAIMRWQGAKPKDKPVAFVGKGVVFDTGGVSIKPASGMEDMKGDMGGAAAVIGLMHVLAARKAKVNAIGIIGLVENAVDGAAQRPGDIVRSMSGQTIEIINTDAEGRLVLCDALDLLPGSGSKPGVMIQPCHPDLAPSSWRLVGTNAGLSLKQWTKLFPRQLTRAGRMTEEAGLAKCRSGREYDKLNLISKFADMKKSEPAAANAGAKITSGGQFPQATSSKDTPWASSRNCRHRDGSAKSTEASNSPGRPGLGCGCSTSWCAPTTRARPGGRSPVLSPDRIQA